MTRRYFKSVGSAGISDVDAIEIYIVIRTETTPLEDLRGEGFLPIDESLTDAEAMKQYRVTMIHDFDDARGETLN